MRKLLSSFILPALGFSMLTSAETLTISSNDITHGKMMSKVHEFNGFGCTGDDLSPHLAWTGAPPETKSFAITVYDPDAPTGSGWWHWQIVNIPKDVREVTTGAGSVGKKTAPKGSVQVLNDYSMRGFGGACPPPGHGIHRYQFTIHALSVETLDLPDNASGALAGYMINANTISSATLEALYQRDAAN